MTLDREAARAAVQTIADALGLPASRTAARRHRRHRQREHVRRAAAGLGRSRATTRATSRWSRSAAPARCTPTRWPGCSARWPVIVPPSPGVLCAYGDATTQPARRSARARSSGAFSRDLRRRGAGRCWPTSPREAQGRLDAEGVPRDEQTRRLPGRRPLPRAGLRGAGRRRPRPASTATGWPASGGPSTPSTTRLFTFALDAEHELVNLRAVVHRPAAADRGRAASCRRAAPTRRPRAAATPRSTSTARWTRGAALRPVEAARRQRGRRARPIDHRDGLDHAGAARPRRHRGRRRHHPHPSRHLTRQRAACNGHASSRPTTTPFKPGRRRPDHRSTSSRTRCATPATRWTRCCSAPPCRPASASSTTSSR